MEHETDSKPFPEQICIWRETFKYLLYFFKQMDLQLLLKNTAGQKQMNYIKLDISGSKQYAQYYCIYHIQCICMYILQTEKNI